MSWTWNVRHTSKIVWIGETIEAVVLKVDETEEKVSLGMKQTEEDPWMALPQKYPVGMRIKGKVRNLTSFGAFVEIEPGIDWLIHISDMSWTKRVQHPSEGVKKGDEVAARGRPLDPPRPSPPARRGGRAGGGRAPGGRRGPGGGRGRSAPPLPARQTRASERRGSSGSGPEGAGDPAPFVLPGTIRLPGEPSRRLDSRHVHTRETGAAPAQAC